MRSQRRGSIYIMTLGTALIVAMLAAAALLAVRTQRRQADLTSDILQANLNAHTGLEMALFRIETDTSWRVLFEEATWSSPLATYYGTYLFNAVDPEDGILDNDPLDPLVITATGVCGAANQKVQVRLKIRQPGMRCLEPVIHSDGNLVFDATTVNGDRMVSSNATLSGTNGSQIYPRAEAKTAVQAAGGSVFHSSTTTEGTWPREMPPASTVLQYYLDEGVEIDIEDLPLLGDQQIANPNMAAGTTGWSAFGDCSLTLVTKRSGTPDYLLVSGRSAPTDGPAQDVTEIIQSGETYAVSSQVKVDGGSMNMRLTLRVVSSGSGTQTFSTTWTTIDSEDFAIVTGNVIPTWTGTLTEAFWILESESGVLDFRFDDASLTVANAPADLRVLHRVVLSPANNPYGDGNTNAQGIYVVNCGTEPILVKDCRIVGTLVLINQDPASSLIRGSVHFEPVVTSPDPSITNLPVLLSDTDLRMSLSAAGLDEGLVNANFNPMGIPYEGSEDSDKQDIYPSLLKGVVYTAANAYIASDLQIQGVLISAGTMTFTGATVQATYDPVFYWDNAPPGFRKELAAEVVPGSYRRVVD